jgi:hypothetical protein
MHIQIPAQIGGDGFFDHIGTVEAYHRAVVFESLLAEMLEQLLHLLDPSDGNTAEHVEGVVG